MFLLPDAAVVQDSHIDPLSTTTTTSQFAIIWKTPWILSRSSPPHNGNASQFDMDISSRLVQMFHVHFTRYTPHPPVMFESGAGLHSLAEPLKSRVIDAMQRLVSPRTFWTLQQHLARHTFGGRHTHRLSLSRRRQC